MEELVLGTNIWGACCSDPDRLLILLFFHLVQHLEECLSGLEWWGQPQGNPAQWMCPGFGSPPAALCPLNVGGTVLVQHAPLFNHVQKQLCGRLSCLAGDNK